MHCVSKQFTLFIFVTDYSLKCWPILIIFGGTAADKICNQRT